jgi:two-component system heavy metal sensor histidine kinase CusS
MMQSFRFHVFLAVVFCVVAFSAASRLLVANSSFDPLHDHFSEVLARHAARELRASPDQINTILFTAALEKSIDNIRPGEILVWPHHPKPPTGPAQTLANALDKAAAEWSRMDGQSPDQPFEMTDIKANAQDWRVLRTPQPQGHVYVSIQKTVLARSADGVLQTRDSIVQKLLPMLLGFIALVTVFLTRSALKPVLTLQKAFARVDLKSQIEHIQPELHYREFAGFIGYFNALIDRLRSSYAQAARFSSDAAHELRTPLTIIRGYLHRLVNESPDGSHLQIQLSLVAEEVERLISISNKLLVLSQADAGRMSLDMQRIDLHEMVGELMDVLKAVYRQLTFSMDVPPGLGFQGDPELIQQLISNLFDHAAKYNCPQGQVNFKAAMAHNSVVFSLSNTTHLSQAGLDDRVFERFYRHRVSENHEISPATGFGLGLSLSREIVTAHGASIRLSLPKDGLVSFACTLPTGS